MKSSAGLVVVVAPLMGSVPLLGGGADRFGLATAPQEPENRDMGPRLAAPGNVTSGVQFIGDGLERCPLAAQFPDDRPDTGGSLGGSGGGLDAPLVPLPACGVVQVPALRQGRPELAGRFL